MDLIPILATVVLIATLATLMLGVLSYVAFRAREKRRPKPIAAPPRKQFFVRVGSPAGTTANGDPVPAEG